MKRLQNGRNKQFRLIIRPKEQLSWAIFTNSSCHCLKNHSFHQLTHENNCICFFTTEFSFFTVLQINHSRKEVLVTAVIFDNAKSFIIPFYTAALPMRVRIIELVTYAMRIIIKLVTIARGMDFFGLFASSPVVAMMSKPMKA